MDAVGDKICANLLAQSVGVNVIPWSGSGLTVPDITIPADVVRPATQQRFA
jgi:acetyl-CoA carboxylase/biotin carboxylase 2